MSPISPEVIQQQKTLLESHRRTLTVYLGQEAKHGLLVPISVSNGIQEARQRIQEIKGILRSWGVECSDHPDDGATSLEEANEAKVYRALRRLNYNEQVLEFRKQLAARSIHAFLLSGPPGNGHHWLLNRLIRLTPNQTASVTIPIDLRGKARGRGIDAVWREFVLRARIKSDPSSQSIAKHIYAWWRTQNVIIIIDNIDIMPISYVNELLSRLWRDVLHMVSSNGDDISQHHIILFLLDYSGDIQSIKENLLNDITILDLSHVPILLPHLDQFTSHLLSEWIRNSNEELPVHINVDAEKYAQILIDETDGGIPEDVLIHICTLCNLNWYDWEKIWVTY